MRTRGSTCAGSFRGSASGLPTLDLSGLILTAAVVVLLAQLVRAYMPLTMALANDLHGVRGYAYGIVGLFPVSVTVVLAVFRMTPLRSQAAVVGTTATVVAARIGVQLIHPIPVWLGIGALGIALGALPALVDLVRRVGGVDSLLTGAVLGLALDASILGAFSTLDPVWQEGALPLATVTVLGIAALVAAAMCHTDRAFTEPSGGWRIALFGPFFALQLLFLQNAAAVASQASVSTATATAIIVAGDAIALAAAGLRLRARPGTDAALAFVGAAGAYALIVVHGLSAAALVIVVQAVAVILLRRALMLDETVGERPETLRMVAPVDLGALLFLAFVFLYQPPTRYRVPLSPAAILALAIVIIWGGALTHRPAVAGRALHPAIALLIAILAVPALLAAVFASPETIAAAQPVTAVTVVTYNIHGATNLDGQVDPEATARAIEAQDPDVVVLQEASRGWPIFGTLDDVEWLSVRLGMPYVFEPAADGQLGNAILSRLPIVRSDGGLLPFGPEPQRRSYVTATIRVGSAELLVIGAHLQGGIDGATRAGQIDRLLEIWDGRSRAIIAGDMNMQPADADVRRLVGAGLVSAQDEFMTRCEPTVVDPDDEEPCQRLDWIFATPDLKLTDFEVVPGAASDHHALAVTVTL